MVYEYECRNCDLVVELNKSMKDHTFEEICHSCGFKMNQIITGGTAIITRKTEFPEYNHGLGTVVKNSKHRAELAKQAGLVEIGNQDINKLGDSLAKDAATRRDKAWDDL